MALVVGLGLLVLAVFWLTCRAPLYAGNGHHGLVMGFADTAGEFSRETVPVRFDRRQLRTYRTIRFRFRQRLYLIEWW
jgi:hypothetical protein